MKKYAKKLLALAMVLAMVLSLGVSAYAIGEGSILYGTGIPPTTAFGSDYSSAYLNPSSGYTTGKVTLVVEAGDSFSWNEYGTIEDSGFFKYKMYSLSNASGITVLDLLNAAAADSSLGLTFSITNDYLSSISRAGTDWDANQTSTVAYWYSGGEWGFDGWVFRVNDKFPVEAVNGGYQGTSISTTYLHDGDIVHFFYDAPSNFDNDNIPAANYLRGTYFDRDSSGVYIQLESHDTFIDQLDNWKFYVNEYEETGAGLAASLYSIVTDPQTGFVTYSFADSATADSDGLLQFSSSITAGTYLLRTDSTIYEFTPDSFFGDMCENAYFDYTSTFCKVVIPAA